MGGCCSSSRKAQLHGAPMYYYCPPSLEGRETLRSFNGTASGLPTGFFVGLNLDTSSPDTFRPPPAPIPFSVLFGCSQTSVDSIGTHGLKCDTSRQSVQPADKAGTNDVNKHDKSSVCGHVDGSEGRTLADILLASPRKSDLEISRPCEFGQLGTEEEDVCPICLEEYDVDNPQMVTSCKHDFHLSCLLEWMERSNSCPVCDKEMIFDHPDDQEQKPI